MESVQLPVAVIFLFQKAGGLDWNARLILMPVATALENYKQEK